MYPKVEFVHKNGKLVRIKARHLESDYKFEIPEIKDAILFYIEENLQGQNKQPDPDY